MKSAMTTNRQTTGARIILFPVCLLLLLLLLLLLFSNLLFAYLIYSGRP